MKDSRVAVITVNYRGSSDTMECVEALLSLDYPDFQVFVVENGSGDDSAKALEQWGKELMKGDFVSTTPEMAMEQPPIEKVVLIKSGKNLGFAGGNNLGARVAMGRNPDYYWFINNDALPESKALSALVATARGHERTGMVCSKVLYHGEPGKVESMGSRLIAPVGIFRHVMHGANDSETPSDPFEVPFVYGCSFLVKAAAVAEIGLMDERYFLLREESDWCLRAREKGWHIYSAPASRVRHKVTTSIGKRSGLFFYYVTRNTLLFMKEHYPLYLIPTALTMAPLVAGLIMVDSLASGRQKLIERLKMGALGYAHFLMGKYGMLEPRKPGFSK